VCIVKAVAAAFDIKQQQQQRQLEWQNQFRNIKSLRHHFCCYSKGFSPFPTLSLFLSPSVDPFTLFVVRLLSDFIVAR